MTRCFAGVLSGCCLLAALSAALAQPAAPQVRAEQLDRGVVAIPTSATSAFISWRLLVDDPDHVTFNVYRATAGAAIQRLTDTPLSGPTCFVDNNVDTTREHQYAVRRVVNGVEQGGSVPFTLAARATPYLSIPLDTPEGYTPSDCSTADLDGDGRYDLVVHQVKNPKDNAHEGVTGAPILQAYTLDARKLWEINLGSNIREGAHYTQFMVYDLDGDGRAEVVCKTADGTVDGQGNVIGDAKANHVNDAGRVLAGPEFLTVFDGRDGRALATTDYIPPRHPDTTDPTGDQLKQVWGDNYGNRSDRFLAAVAYLDGQHPSVVMCRGYYTRSVLAAWDWRDGKLTQRWVFDSATPGNEAYSGQGAHSICVADVDGDGRDEIIYGAATINADGTGRYSTRLHHGDALHVGDLDPTRPGLEVYMALESPRRNGNAGAAMWDASTGEILWTVHAEKDIGRAVAVDIDPRHPGVEAWSTANRNLYNARGEVIHDNRPGPINFAAWWDGDLTRELLDKTSITKWDPASSTLTTLLDTAEFDCVSNNGTKATPALSADILGDWREEVIFRTTDNKELRIFTTTIPTEHRMVTLMQDRQYRLAIAWQNVAYNQPPHPGFFPGAVPADSMPSAPAARTGGR